MHAWQRVYAGIVPDHHLDGLDVSSRAAQLARRFGPMPRPAPSPR
ncbi:MAG TPA: hypothetical protein VK060_02230 [Ruania sp.]|nr:hypothetical protein [Ruania sp.]